MPSDDYLALDDTGDPRPGRSEFDITEQFYASLEQSRARRRSGMTASEYVLAALMALVVIAAGAVFCAYVLYLLA